MPASTHSVQSYLDALDVDRRDVVEQLRALVRTALPKAVESMAYRMPTFELDEPVCSIAAQKHHYALYVCDIELIDEYRDRLGDLDVGKSCIRFRRIEQLPQQTLRALLKDAANRQQKHVKADSPSTSRKPGK